MMKTEYLLIKNYLGKHYITNGYADFRVLSANSEMTKDKSGFIITFTLEEGNKYNFGNINVTSSIKNIDTDLLLSETSTIEGELFNASLIENSVDSITNILTDAGYAFC